MWQEYIKALFLVFVAEMGDKTQILAMMFSTKYKVRHVLAGVCIGAALNHGIAVFLGAMVGVFIDTSILQLIAGLAFLGFALWTLFAPKDDEEEETHQKGGAIFTVASAFFIGELGDKTQLTAITLAVDATYPLIILMGTVSGMIVTSAIGIFVGSKVGDKIPDRLIQLISSCVFLIFGCEKVLSSPYVSLANPIEVSGLVILALIAGWGLYRVGKEGIRSGELTPLRRAAKNLYDYTNKTKTGVDSLCKSAKVCRRCEKEACPVGLMRHILKDVEDGKLDHENAFYMKQLHLIQGKFKKETMENLLKENLRFLLSYPKKDKNYEEINTIRKVLELSLFGEFFDELSSKELKGYYETLQNQGHIGTDKDKILESLQVK